jgi:hypothetical protein
LTVNTTALHALDPISIANKLMRRNYALGTPDFKCSNPFVFVDPTLQEISYCKL